MHILVLPSWYASPDSPNSGSFFREQAQALARRGHKVSVLVIRSAGEGDTRLLKQENGGITEYYLLMRSLPFHLTGALVMAELVRLFRREFRKEKIDIIHVHAYRAGRYARFIKAVFGIPYVVTEHFAGIRTGSVAGKELEAARKVYAGASAVVAVSTGLRDSIAPYCPGEVKIIPNMVSDRFFAGDLRAEAEGGLFRFVSTGNLDDHDKGADVLLRAFAELYQSAPQARLTVIGGGDQEPYLKLAQELGITETVTFTGLISREAVAQELRRSHTFVLLSRIETFGVCFVEAMACGLPIVMSKTDAWEMLVTPETGLAVDIEDATGAAKAMQTVMDRWQDYDPAAISRYCKNSFSEECVTKRLTELFTQVLKD